MLKNLLSNTIIRNFSVLTGTNILIQFISILSSIRLTRLLQPEGYGLYNLLMVEASIFAIIAVFGLKMVIIRYVARNKSESKYVFNISNRIRLVTTLLAIICFITYNIFIKESHFSTFLLIMLSFFIVFQTFWNSIESIAFGNEQMASSGYINLLFTSLWVIAIYVIPKASFNIEVLFSIFILIQFLKTISYYFWLKKKVFLKGHNTISPPDIDYKYFIRQSNYYFILAVFSAIQLQVPVLLLNHNSTLDQVGIFNLGFRILSPMQMVLSMALASIYPSLSRLALENKELFATRIKSLMNLLVVIGVWACICFTLFSRDVVLLLYGDAYLSAAKVILIQCWFTLLFGIFSTIGTVLSSFDKQRLLAILSIIYGTLAFPIFFFGSKYGAIGLAWAFVIAAYIHMTYHWIIFKNLLSPYLSFKYTFKLFSIMIVATIGSLFVPFEFSFILKVLIGISVTLVAGYLLKYRILKEYSVPNLEM